MILYFETGNLVKLYAEEADSDKITASVREADVVATSIIPYTEARAVLTKAGVGRYVQGAQSRNSSARKGEIHAANKHKITGAFDGGPGHKPAPVSHGMRGLRGRGRTNGNAGLASRVSRR
jgi:hypothetical protein